MTTGVDFMFLWAAAVSRKAGEPLVMEEIMVAPPQPFEVRIRIICTALCHSDVTFWKLQVSVLFRLLLLFFVLGFYTKLVLIFYVKSAWNRYAFLSYIYQRHKYWLKTCLGMTQKRNLWLILYFLRKFRIQNVNRLRWSWENKRNRHVAMSTIARHVFFVCQLLT